MAITVSTACFAPTFPRNVPGCRICMQCTEHEVCRIAFFHVFENRLVPRFVTNESLDGGFDERFELLEFLKLPELQELRKFL